MEELFVYSLLYDVGYEKVNEYEETLNHLFLNNPEDRNLLDLEGMAFKDAMFHLRHLINVTIILLLGLSQIITRLLSRSILIWLSHSVMQHSVK